MKKLILVLFLIPLFSMAQEYTDIIEVPNKKAHQLYISSKEWFALTFKSVNNVIQMDDSLSGKLIGKGSTICYETTCIGEYLYDIDFNVAIAVKDNKYKASITDILVGIRFNADPRIVMDPEMIRLSSITQPKKPFSLIVDQKEYYKNGTDLGWLMKEQKEKYGFKMTKTLAKITCDMNRAVYKMACGTEEKMKLVLKSLELKMKINEDNW